MSAPTTTTAVLAEWLAGIARAVGVSGDDYRPHAVVAAVADMVEDLGANIQRSDVVGALALVLNSAILDPGDVEVLLDAGCGVWTERVS